MARYFFHIMDDEAIIDTVGVELPDMDRVRTEAIRASGQMLATGEQTWAGDAWHMIVADEANTIVFSVRFSVDRHGR